MSISGIGDRWDTVVFQDGIAQELGSLPLESTPTIALVSDTANTAIASRRFHTNQHAAWMQSIFAPPFTVAAPSPPLSPGSMVVESPFVAYRGRTAQHAAWMPSLFAPTIIPSAIAGPSLLPAAMLPQPRTMRSWRNGFRANFAKVIMPPPPTVAIPARGGAIVSVLRMDPEEGSSITYSWATDVIRPRSGRESREGLRAVPRESYAFSSLLDDDDLITIQSALIRNAAIAAKFGVGIEQESLEITGANPGTRAVGVLTTAYSDWLYPGSPALLVGHDASDLSNYMTAVVQSNGLAQIDFDVNVTAFQAAGCRVMPLIPCLLDEQSFALHYVNAGMYDMRARAQIFGYQNGLWTIHGATVNTWTSALGNTWPIFDRRIEMSDTSPRALMPMAETIDRGGAIQQVGMQAVADVAREILVTLRNDADRQYLKAFLGTVRGKHKAFLLPTWKPDLLPIGDASSGSLTFEGPSWGRINYGEWFASDAHKVLRVELTSGAVRYEDVFDWGDNHDGTQTVLLAAGFANPIAMVSLMETCRLDTDDVPIQAQGGGVGTCRIPVHVVQQAT